MTWSGEQFGPTGASGIVGVSRGNIRQGKWLIPGMRHSHQLALDSGFLGLGPVHVKCDGTLILTLPKPSRPRPSVVSSKGLIDGYEIVVHAALSQNGRSIEADVFVGGRSLTTGVPLSVTAEHQAAFDRWAAWQQEREREAPIWRRKLSSASRWAAMAGVAEIVALVRHAASPGEAGLVGALIVGSNMGIAEAGIYAARRVAARGWSASRNRVANTIIAAICCAAVLAVLVVATVALTMSGSDR